MMSLHKFKGFIDDIEADILYIRLIDIDKPEEELYAEISTKFINEREKKYIKEGAVFRLYVREDKVLIRFLRPYKISKNNWIKIKKEAKKLGKMLKV